MSPFRLQSFCCIFNVRFNNNFFNIHRGPAFKSLIYSVPVRAVMGLEGFGRGTDVLLAPPSETDMRITIPPQDGLKAEVIWTVSHSVSIATHFSLCLSSSLLLVHNLFLFLFLLLFSGSNLSTSWRSLFLLVCCCFFFSCLSFLVVTTLLLLMSVVLSCVVLRQIKCSIHLMSYVLQRNVHSLFSSVSTDSHLSTLSLPTDQIGSGPSHSVLDKWKLAVVCEDLWVWLR